MIPLTFDKAKDFIEAMELHTAYDMTKADWERDGYMAILSRLTHHKDLLLALLQFPMCQRLPFCLEVCLLAGKEVEPLMPRMAKAFFEDLTLNPHYMDIKARQDRIWARADKAFKQQFRETETSPNVLQYEKAAGVAAYEATLIYCTPAIPLDAAHKAMMICVDAAIGAQNEFEGGNTLLSKLLTLGQREWDAYRQALLATRPMADFYRLPR